MARVILLPGIASLHGSISPKSDYYYRTTNGKTYVCNKPSKRDFTKHPVSHQETTNRNLFTHAHKMAIEINKSNELRAHYWQQYQTISPKKRAKTFNGYLVQVMMRELKGGVA